MTVLRKGAEIVRWTESEINQNQNQKSKNYKIHDKLCWAVP